MRTVFTFPKTIFLLHHILYSAVLGRLKRSGHSPLFLFEDVFLIEFISVHGKVGSWYCISFAHMDSNIFTLMRLLSSPLIVIMVSFDDSWLQQREKIL